MQKEPFKIDPEVNYPLSVPYMLGITKSDEKHDVEEDNDDDMLLRGLSPDPENWQERADFSEPIEYDMSEEPLDVNDDEDGEEFFGIDTED